MYVSTYKKSPYESIFDLTLSPIHIVSANTSHTTTINNIQKSSLRENSPFKSLRSR